MTTDNQENKVVEIPSDDTPSGFLGLTYGQIRDWEAKSAKTCKTYHEQPCNCDPWD